MTWWKVSLNTALVKMFGHIFSIKRNNKCAQTFFFFLNTLVLYLTCCLHPMAPQVTDILPGGSPIIKLSALTLIRTRMNGGRVNTAGGLSRQVVWAECKSLDAGCSKLVAVCVWVLCVPGLSLMNKCDPSFPQTGSENIKMVFKCENKSLDAAVEIKS